MDSVQVRLFLYLKRVVDQPRLALPHAVVLTDLDFIAAYMPAGKTAAWVADTFERYTVSRGLPLEIVFDHAALLEGSMGDLERYVCLLMRPVSETDDEDSYVEVNTIKLY